MTCTSDWNQKPTIRQEIVFLSHIYKSRKELLSALNNHGYRWYRDVAVPRVHEYLSEPHQDSQLTLGVCVADMTVMDTWDETTQCKIQEILRYETDNNTIEESTRSISRAVEEFIHHHNDVFQDCVRLNVCICGYSLGGTFSQVAAMRMQHWARRMQCSVTCRTYESCGVPDIYHEATGSSSNGSTSQWHRTIQNYKSLPNPLNSVYRDLGRCFHLINMRTIICYYKWAWRCVSASARRLSCSLFAATLAVTAMARMNFSATTEEQLLTLVSERMALHFSLKLKDLIRTHNLDLMLWCFDSAGDVRQDMCYEMDSWPSYNDIKDADAQAMSELVGRFVFFEPKNPGVHTLLALNGKSGFIKRRLETFPGYIRKLR